jgi:uncharacterized protein (TIGR02391 family)
MLITHTQVDELLDKLVDLSGLDEELFDRCGFLIRAERYDEAVSRAFVVLEERLRELLGVSGGSGVHLAQKAFAPKSGDLVERSRRPAAEVEGIRDLFVGAFKAYRNRSAHTVAGFSLDEARGIIHLVDLLLLILNQVSQAPTERVPNKISQALGPAVTERLCLFLERLKNVGIHSGRGTTWHPYQTKLMYQAPGWEEPRPHQFTVFYLSSVPGEPVLAFYMKALKHVPGLDIAQLEKDLLEAGCKRVASKDRYIMLFLSERNNQATFDRIYEILKALSEKFSQVPGTWQVPGT